ncbi:YbfB/YjiJ family MFS transporter [Paenibacillus chondroitinus]|uniref:YbfB/YjiJ family MFS transporter n=1 Tax=Paenibacillus chondroitinus TaxID=59842 RepID=A0ABU6DDA2_9BACL|nr:MULTISPECIES: YbfB/YjiJ family MFS transporter [Paenibacillus]MCY9659916.1 YbfB/YjiJ family MFS transporter [Paenibacillus anseongense]MEB4795466.1 YbfB/YjiJ family MFS transporter [Paenibacillus chondroitinus]
MDLGYKSAFNRITLWASLLFAVILGFSRLSYGLFLPGIQREIGGSYAELGILATVNFIGYFLGTLYLPLIISRFRHKKNAINRISCLLLGLAMIGSAFSDHFIQLGLWRFMIGFFSASATVLVLSIATDAVQPPERGMASGLIWLGGSAGILITGLFAPYIIEPAHLDGWRYAWMAMGIFGILATVGFELVTRKQIFERTRFTELESNSGEQEQVSVYRLMFSPNHFLFLLGSYFFFGWGYIIYFTFLVPYLVNKGIPSIYAGLIWSGIGAAGLFNGWIGGRAIDRWPSGYTLALGLAIGTTGVLAVTTNRILLTSIGAVVIGLVSFITPPLMTTALLRRYVPSSIYAVCLSVATATFAAGQIIGPMVGGWVVDQYGLKFGVTSSSLFMALSALFACLYGRKQGVLETPTLLSKSMDN